MSAKPIKFLNLYFQVHQPRRLRKFHFFDIGTNAAYFDDDLNQHLMRNIAESCYLPANNLLLKAIRKNPALRITFSISGTALEQFEKYAPDVLDGFRKLAATGAVEFLGETYYHSLSFLTDLDEFNTQVEQHRRKMIGLLDVRPQIFRNTELTYNDPLGKNVFDLGFKGMYVEGTEAFLKNKPVNKLYRHPSSPLVLFPRNYSLSDDIAFRYADRNWSHWPLTPSKYLNWLKKVPADQNFITLGIDYETFGEHHKATQGIFKFLNDFLLKAGKNRSFRFITPSEALSLTASTETISTSKIISWADQAKDLSAWLGNDLQRDAFSFLNKLHPVVMNTRNRTLINQYRYLQTSDHFYYMSTKMHEDGNIHQYFSPYSSPYEAFMNFMNVLADLELKVKNEIRKQSQRIYLNFLKDSRNKTRSKEQTFLEY